MSTSSIKKMIQISEPVIGEQECLAVQETLKSGWTTQGPKVREFERNFANIHQSKSAIASTSCTTALHLILKALNIKEGDEVIVPAFTWVSTANVVEHCLAVPIFVDIDINTFNIDPKQLKEKISSKTKAIIAVHLFGLCADIKAIKKIANNIPIIEDAACAAGSFSPEGMAGSLGIAGAFSFHPRKIISTGEGGIITTNKQELADKIDVLRNHGASLSEEKRHHSSQPFILPDFNVCGFNYRMTDIQASVGIIQLEKLKEFIDFRQYWAAFYQEQLSDIKWLKLPEIPKGYGMNWQSFVCVFNKSKHFRTRNEIMLQLQEKGISTRPGTHAVHLLGYYQSKYQFKDNDFPAANLADQQTLAIPLHNKMTEEDFKYIVDIIKGL
ncbi:perosamine synthetase [Candidatus Marinamargulisbacteria bacterium SCGC AG-410-N11]|nr:perosamine synthetase [Candidatus Marinamargulisbacteria bacterium SCGC AG-410-N11]